ncbi:MAG: helix-turn-helix transcriptional regulator [Caldilineaceae bacterium]
MSTEEIHSFGDWLRQQRKVHDWSQATLAQRSGCTAAMIRKIEAGERKPSAQLAALLADALALPAAIRPLFLQVARQLRPVTDLLSPSVTPAIATPSRGTHARPQFAGPHDAACGSRARYRQGR